MKKKSYLFLFTYLFIFLTIILYRHFLYSYRMQLENFLPYFNYQNQILFYLTGDKNLDIQAPMNLRFLGLITQYIIFKFIPCIELTNINTILYQNYVCATYSNALMNYLSMTCFLSLIFIYTLKKSGQNFTISFISLLLAFIFFYYLEAFTLDRISVLYFLAVLFFLDKKKICLTLILLSCLVNEKIIIILVIYFFIKCLFLSEKKYIPHFLLSLFSLIIYFSIFIFYVFVLKNGYYQHEDPNSIYNTIFSDGIARLERILLHPKGISNSLFPIIFSLSPYCYLLYKKDKKNSYEILIPLALIFFGIGGGTTNVGRYVMYSMPLWIPIMSNIIYKKLRN
jgi:hypothetical protein